MPGDFRTNKWIIGGVLLLIIIAGGCYFWYQHSLADDRKAAADAAEYARRLENQKAKQEAATETKTTLTKAPAENNTAEKLSTNNEVGNNTEAETLQQSDTSAQTAETKDVPVSPFGFGPYPEIPDDYIIPPDKFNWDFWGETLQDELISRVRIKLWNQGIRSEGSSFENGKVYPTILGTVYVVWDGDRIRRISGHPDDDFDAIEAALEAGQPPPEGITVLNRNEAGIDPYSFLELNKKE